MATPIGHLLAGQVAFRVGSKAAGAHGTWLAAWCGVAAMAPDFDFLPGLLVGTPALYHQGVSHSIAVGLVVGLVLAVAYRRGARRVVGPWLVLTLAYWSHLLLDLFGPDRRPPYGIPLFWPWSDAAFLAPFTLLPGVKHADTTGVPTGIWVDQILQSSNVTAIALEIVWVAPFVILAEWWSRQRGASRPKAGHPLP